MFCKYNSRIKYLELFSNVTSAAILVLFTHMSIQFS